MASFPLVHRRAKDVHYIVGFLRSLTTRYDLVLSCQGAGPLKQSCITEPPRPFGRLVIVRLTDARLTKQCLIWPSNVNGTTPETYERVDFSTSLQYCTATVTR